VNKYFWVCALSGVMASTATAGPAAWCKGNTDVRDSDLHDLTSNDPRTVLIMLAKTACSTSPAVEQQRAAIDQARAAWGSKYGLAGGDWADMIALSDKGTETLKIDYSAKTLADLTPIDQFRAISEGFIDKNARQLSDALYLADAFGSQLSQTGRFALLKSYCLKDDTNNDDGPFARWAVCQDDFDKFDIAKLYEELRADTAHDAAMKMQLRLEVHEIPGRIAAVVAKEPSFFKKDGEYKRAFDVTAAARADWAKGPGTNKDLLDLVQAMDSASYFHSRKLTEGCEAKTAAALARAVSTIPAKAFATAHDTRDDPFHGFGYKAAPVIANSPVTYLAAMAYFVCQPESGTGVYLAGALNAVPGTRGPRTSALSALMGVEFKFDDTNKKGLDFPLDKGRPSSIQNGALMSAGGVVKSLKPAKGKRGAMKGKDITEVMLEKTLIKQEDCVQEHRGNHVARIENGQVTYESICDKTAIVTHDHTWANFTVNSAHAKWLTPGVVFSANYGIEGGDVLVIWPSKNATVPSMVLGGTVK
jgi:hypothetical protein